MTESTSSGAASRRTDDWDQVDWKQAERTVRRLQARIVKATQQGRWNKVHALQRLLTRSYSGKALAVKRVTENRGKRTPGVDGETWNTPRQKVAAIHRLRQRGYKPLPLRRDVLIRGDANPFDPADAAYFDHRRRHVPHSILFPRFLEGAVVEA